MNWKKIKQIEGVSSFPKFMKGNLFYFDIRKKFVSLKEKSFAVNGTKQFDKEYHFDSDNGIIHFFDEDKIYLLKEENLDINEEWKSKKGIPSIFNNKYLLERDYNRKDKSLKISVYSRQNGELIWERIFVNHRFPRNIHGTLFITDINYTYMIKIDLKTGQEIWRYDLPSGEKVGGSIKLYENVLIIPASNNHLYALDSESGNSLWELPDRLYHYNLDNESELLYGYSRDKYEVIDPKNGDILITKKFEGSEEKYRISPQAHMNTLSGDGIYFMSNWYEPRFGKININNHEIEFVQELEVEEGVKGDIPVYHEGRLYIRDSMNTLHVFERE